MGVSENSGYLILGFLINAYHLGYYIRVHIFLFDVQMLRNPVLIFQALRVDPKIHLLGLSTLGIRKAVLFFCERVLAGGGLRFRILVWGLRF